MRLTRKYPIRGRERFALREESLSRRTDLSYLGNRIVLVTEGPRPDSPILTTFRSPSRRCWRWMLSDDCNNGPYKGLVGPFQPETFASETELAIFNTFGDSVTSLRVDQRQGSLRLAYGVTKQHLRSLTTASQEAEEDAPFTFEVVGVAVKLSDRLEPDPEALKIERAELQIPRQPSRSNLPGRFLEWTQQGNKGYLVEMPDQEKNGVALNNLLAALQDLATRFGAKVSSFAPELGPLTGVWVTSEQQDSNSHYDNELLIFHIPEEAEQVCGSVLMAEYTSARAASSDWWVSIGVGYVRPVSSLPLAQSLGSEVYGVSVRLLPQAKNSHGEIRHMPPKEHIRFIFRATHLPSSSSTPQKAIVEQLQRYTHNNVVYSRLSAHDPQTIEPLSVTTHLAPAVSQARAHGLLKYDIWFAASLGDTEGFQRFIQDDPEHLIQVSELLRRPSPMGDMQPLLLACSHGNLNIVRIIYELSMNPRYAVHMQLRREGIGSTALGWAACHSHWDVVRFLIETVDAPIDENTRGKLERPQRNETGEERQLREMRWRMLLEIDEQFRQPSRP
uniref:Uncharacterized protein n=1 Tax=Tetraselmis sp. GSL018 TaxID=582737 RepID=A0A061SGK7_9CHLO|eukprot:CAMPEP_0177588664 /NCGR_PEP_ID=MMETSP0419_2-20121207/6351_1 /TAXON_ID=582737 /ORGANISM="Tetraselmis sp., Strain GSL018" /LENGTH=559 /DNA_ID=CAMNT_0019078887 /DNA_START=308 /DNA_END=1987 /DNA_ORIENTATION=-